MSSFTFPIFFLSIGLFRRLHTNRYRYHISTILAFRRYCCMLSFHPLLLALFWRNCTSLIVLTNYHCSWYFWQMIHPSLIYTSFYSPFHARLHKLFEFHHLHLAVIVLTRNCCVMTWTQGVDDALISMRWTQSFLLNALAVFYIISRKSLAVFNNFSRRWPSLTCSHDILLYLQRYYY